MDEIYRVPRPGKSNGGVMNETYKFTRIKDAKHTYENHDDIPAPKEGDFVKLSSSRGCRLFIVRRDLRHDIHCYTKCGISKGTCNHYRFLCSYFNYLEPVEQLLEEL